jgi:uncharacterized OsmC-like protein
MMWIVKAVLVLCLGCLACLVAYWLKRKYGDTFEVLIAVEERREKCGELLR